MRGRGQKGLAKWGWGLRSCKRYFSSKGGEVKVSVRGPGWGLSPVIALS